jgi:hypothetical protein
LLCCGKNAYGLKITKTERKTINSSMCSINKSNCATGDYAKNRFRYLANKQFVILSVWCMPSTEFLNPLGISETIPQFDWHASIFLVIFFV